MKSFIGACACHGVQPSGVVSRKRVSRPEAVAKLLKDRKVTRFVIAPDGYGKTHVAFEYANIMFAFQHVFWIKAASPCFVRDLDARTLTEGILEADKEAKLVVFDALPSLDPDRTEALSAMMDELLAAHCEVIVTCTPHSDTFAHRQKDRIVINASDLLLAQTEVAVLGLEKIVHGNVACIAWDAQGAARLLDGCAAEAMPADVKLALFTLLALENGALEEALSLFDDVQQHEIVRHLRDHYTFLGIDADGCSFNALRLSASLLKDHLLPSFDEVLSASALPDGDGVALHLADLLFARSHIQRARDMLMSYATSQGMARWVRRCGWRALWCGEALSIHELMSSAFKKKAQDDQMRLLAAWVAWLLDEGTEAAKRCMRIAHAQQAGAKERVGALALLFHLKGNQMDQEHSFMLAEALSSLKGMDAESQAAQDTAMDWQMLGEIVFACAMGEGEEGKESLAAIEHADELAEPHARSASLNALLIGVAWAAEKEACAVQTDGGDDHLRRLLDSLVRIVDVAAGCFHAGEGEGRWLSVGLSQSMTVLEGHPEALRRITGTTMRLLVKTANDVRPSLIEQARSNRVDQERIHEQHAAFDATHPDIFRFSSARPVIALSSVPQLEIRMFGGLEVRIDGQMVDPRKLSRRRAKVLTSVLALNKGHEMTRERLCEVVWDGSRFTECKNSFYSIWAVLKRALMVEGECPYLIRSQTGCSLDARYLSTDMEEFESICSTLVFGGDDARSWEEAYAQVVSSFSDALLPTERENAYLNDVRERCKNRIVDGLISASSRLLRSGERTGALWFSREALRRDEEREDVYISLMESQIASNQRGPALETYFKCRKFMTGELGIDPSPRLVELYRSIIEYEEAI